jgi:hypothetical protein
MAKVKGSDIDYSPVDLLKLVLKSIGENVERKASWDYWKFLWSALDTGQKKEFLVNSIRGAKAKPKIVSNLSKYIGAKLPGTIPYGIKESIDKAHKYAKSPLNMTKAGSGSKAYESGIEEMVEAAFEVAGLSMVPGHAMKSGTVVAASGIRRQAARNIKHTLSDTTLKKIAADMKVDTSDVKGVSGRILAELDTQTPKSKGLGNVKKAALSTAPVSPENIYKFEKSGSGNLIYRTMNLADQGLNRFGAKVVREYKKAAGGIKAGSPSSLKIGKALDAKDKDVGKLVGELSKKELKLYNYLKGQFDFLINKYAKSALETPKRYKKITSAVNSKVPPMAKLEDLSKPLRIKYDKQVKRILDYGMKKGVPQKKLSSKDQKVVDNMRKELDKIKQKGWVESLDDAEKSVYSLLKKKIKNYLPHIFDRNELLKGFSDELDVQRLGLRQTTDPKEISKIKKRIEVLQSNIDKTKGGELVTYEQLPKSLRFGSFLPRKGAMGYGFDSVKAYGTYARGIADKIYKDPAMKKIKYLYKDLSPEYKQYAFSHVNEWVGKKRTGGQQVADWLTTAQWSLKLGGNPRSALQNILQRSNTLALVGEKHAIVGYLKGWTKEGKKLFEESGLREEVPEVLLEGKIPKPLKLVKAILGKMFTLAEVGNRKHAFLSGLEQARKMGLKDKKATQHAIDLVHRTQFRYGTVGLPAVLRNPVGRVAFQFSSYPIKQSEFLLGLLKNDPKALLRWVAYAEGGKRLVESETGWELGTALGTGIDFGEVLEAVKQVPEGDWDNFIKHSKLALAGGNVIPGIGPTLGAVGSIYEGMKNYRGGRAALEEIKPVQYKKGEKLYQGIKHAKETDDGYMLPQFDSKGYLNLDLTPGEAFTTFLGPNLKKLSELNKEKSLKFENSRIENSLQRDLNKSIAEGDVDTAIDIGMKLMNFGDYGKGAIGRNVPWEDRELLEKTSRDYLLGETLFK